MEKELKYGDNILFTLVPDAASKIEGRFVGYSNLNKTKCIVEYGGPFAVMIAYALTCEKKPEPKKRLMTAKELCGKWIRPQLENTAYLSLGYFQNKVIFLHDNFTILPYWKYTDTPTDDSSWKSVLVDEE